MPDDGVTWLENAQGVSALYVAPNSSAERAGIKPGDQLLAINDVSVHRAVEVTKRLWSLGAWSQAHYQLARHNRTFEALLIVAPAPKPLAIENYLRIVGLLYLFIGLFIFVRRWNAARAVHFYIFCLVSFILCSFHYTGKLNLFDWEVYWARAAALLLAPALLLHFALVFPERSIARRGWHRLWTIAAYVPPLVLLLVHIDVVTNWLGFVPYLPARGALDQIELGYLGLYFLLAAAIFLHSYRRTRSGILRQQLKWVTGGTLAGIGPFAVFYIVPYALGAIPRPWMNLSSLSLALVPLCFAYAIIRYRLMDVDIIFKRGLAYTAATAGGVGGYFLVVGGIAELSHNFSWAQGTTGGMLAIVLAAFLLQPFRDWSQLRLDRFFYRDRLDFRRTLIEFGRTLTNEVHIEPMLASVMDRISQTLLVDRLAVFLVDEQTGKVSLARAL